MCQFRPDDVLRRLQSARTGLAPNKARWTSFAPFAVAAGVLAMAGLVSAQTVQAGAPTHLRCESLEQPMGMDEPHPLLSWQLHDGTHGARQTAYQILVASSASSLSGKPDIWDSGRVESDQSVGVPYAGPALAAEKRYFWQVKVWGKDGKAYPASAVSWWETGLLSSGGWRGNWIGYEEEEHRRLREANAEWVTNPGEENYKPAGDTHHNFRYALDIAKPVKRADLFVAGEDTPAAWVNGQQVLQAQPLPPWKQSPWKTYARKDVTRQLRVGKNLVAVDVTLYAKDRQRPGTDPSRAPMNATLYVEMSDGSVQIFKTGSEGWMSALDTKGDWQAVQFDDSGWKAPVTFKPPSSPFGDSELGKPWPTGPVKTLRRTFDVSKPISSARLYATALGAYNFFINGRIVGDQLLAPGWMDFRQHVPYQVYDVTKQINSGRNAIGAYLAPGWYTTPLQWFRQGYNYGDTPPALRAQLRIEHTDGSVDWVVSDASWKAEVSPIQTAEIYDGETFDARQLQRGWDTTSFDDSKWQSAVLIRPTHEPEIVWQSFQPIRAERTLTAKAITSPKPGVYIFDFGQNLAGVPRVHVNVPAGTDVQLRFAELLNPDGTMYVDNLRTAKATDHYIAGAAGMVDYQPTFTFHGFRYAEISGLTSKPDTGAVQAVVLHTDAPFSAHLQTGSKMVNQLWSNILWGQRSNFVGVPTDCPQRDERLGWTGDAQVFWRTASYNMDLGSFSKKFAADLRSTQSGTPMYGIFAPSTLPPNPGYAAGWSDAGVIVPWTSWVQTGDKRIIEQNWDGMSKYLGAIEEANPDHLWKKNYGIPFGDWLSPEGVTPEDLIATAYWAYDVTLMQQMAQATGRSADEQHYKELFGQIKGAFNQAYVRSDGFVGGVAPPPVFASATERPLSKEPVDTQTSYVLSLYMKLLPDSVRQAAAKRLVDKISANKGVLGTGFLGTPYLLEALSDSDRSDAAYNLLLKTDYPSWGYLVEHGATTMWERWNGDQMMNDPSMNSYNHYAYGAVGEWIYRYAAGIDTVARDPGFHTIYLHPNFDARIGSLDFIYESGYGPVHSSWTASGGSAHWTLVIPANAKGQLPLTAEQESAFSLDDGPITQSKKVHKLEAAGQEHVYEVPAGAYSFTVKLQQ
jgi:alpha-L-rhamnosidase